MHRSRHPLRRPRPDRRRAQRRRDRTAARRPAADGPRLAARRAGTQLGLPRCWLAHRARGVGPRRLCGAARASTWATGTSRTCRAPSGSASSWTRSTRASSRTLRRSSAAAFPPTASALACPAATMAVVSTHHRHLGCLLPQHGPGKKHERAIVFEPWQRAHVEAAPWAFLRGCIRSDGCTFVNRFGRYAYLSYEFRNRSEGIKAPLRGVLRPGGRGLPRQRRPRPHLPAAERGSAPGARRH